MAANAWSSGDPIASPDAKPKSTFDAGSVLMAPEGGQAKPEVDRSKI
jgi:hypothetical protein